MAVRFRVLPAGAAGGRGLRDGPAVERTVDVADDRAEIRIGRRTDLELTLPYPALSALQARLSRDRRGGWQIEDADSTNGTWLDGERLFPGEPRPLTKGARLTLAGVTVVFDGTSAASGKVDGTATIARRLVADLFASTPRAAIPELEVVAGPEPGRRLSLADSDRPYLVGRGEGCDLPLVIEEISREHAAFVSTSHGVVVRDLGSKNGILVAGARVVSEHRLDDGDIVELGAVSLRLHDPVSRYLRELERAPPVPQENAAPPARPSRATAVVVAFAVAVLAAVAVAALVLLRWAP